MLVELELIEIVCKELEKQGYSIKLQKKTKKHEGIDIIASKKTADFDRRLFIEAVGETSSEESSNRFGLPFDSSQSKVHVAELLFESAKNYSSTRIQGYDYRFGLAVPDNEIHRKLISDIQKFLDFTDIAVFFVASDKHISVHNQNWVL